MYGGKPDPSKGGGKGKGKGQSNSRNKGKGNSSKRPNCKHCGQPKPRHPPENCCKINKKVREEYEAKFGKYTLWNEKKPKDEGNSKKEKLKLKQKDNPKDDLDDEERFSGLYTILIILMAAN